MRLALASLALVFVSGCGGPLGPFAGGELSGEPKPAPADWSVVRDAQQVQLETDPAAPHSVNTWIGVANGALYVPTSMIRGPLSPSERDWVKNVQADARVRLRIEDSIYALSARRVGDEAEYAAARAALEAKYELAPDDMDPQREIWIFRLDSR